MYRRAIQPEHFCELNLKILVPFFYKHVCVFIQPSGVENHRNVIFRMNFNCALTPSN